MNKPLLLIDFDGVIHSYKTGWQGVDVIAEDPVPGAFVWLREALIHFRVAIYSSRSREVSGLVAMMNWFKVHGWPEVGGCPNDLEFPVMKPPAFLTIDDRCICFEGAWPDPKSLLSFKPWTKRKVDR